MCISADAAEDRGFDAAYGDEHAGKDTASSFDRGSMVPRPADPRTVRAQAQHGAAGVNSMLMAQRDALGALASHFFGEHSPPLQRRGHGPNRAESSSAMGQRSEVDS
jgi:hypothetical protein